MTATQDATKEFLEGLKKVAETMKADAQNQGENADNFNEAAENIYPLEAANDITASQYGSLSGSDCDNVKATSLANKYKFFFAEQAMSACGITTLIETTSKMLKGGIQGANGAAFKDFVTNLDYVEPDNKKIIYSAFRPGERNQVELETGEASHPFLGSSAGSDALRNFYSTKLIAMRKLFTSGGTPGDLGSFFAYNDKSSTSNQADLNYGPC